MIELVIDIIGNWAIWKSADFSPSTMRRIAVIFLWLCAFATVGVVFAILMLVR